MKMSMIKPIILLAAIAGATNIAVQHIEWPKAKMTVQVIDEKAQPVKDAVATFYYMNSSTKTTTDIKGFAVGEANCDLRGIGCNIRKEGFYLGGTPDVKFHHNEILNHWEPWNETYKVILRPIGKPVALYAKKVRADIPVLGKPCGYDLEAGDWVTPYGKGMKKDLVFTIQTKEVRDAGNYDAQGELNFKLPLDGMLETSVPEIGKGSAFRWERQAPENGYQSNFKLQNTWWKSLHQKPIRSFKFGGKEWEGYFFRVRTVEQNGKIVSAHYGKIRGGIEIEPRETPTCTITFTYYLNPTPNDRNLEWDQKKNLFGGLTDMEIPREP
jgi:hypothetical protein